MRYLDLKNKNRKQSKIFLLLHLSMSLTLTSSLPVLTELYFIARFLHSAEAQNDKNESMTLSFTFRAMDAVARSCTESQQLFQELCIVELHRK